jgi:hypothetical protein
LNQTYSDLVNALILASKVDFINNSDAVSYLPTIILNAEQGLYRDLDLISCNITVTGSVAQGSRIVAIPTSYNGSTIHMLVLDALNVLDNNNNRYSAVPATREAIDYLYPNDVSFKTPSFPRIFCRSDDANIMIGPPVDQTYTGEFIGTIRPAPLSSTNTTTFLSLYCFDALFKGCMVEVTGYMRDFGSQADDPKISMSWMQAYQTALASLRKEELRKSYMDAASVPPLSARSA